MYVPTVPTVSHPFLPRRYCYQIMGDATKDNKDKGEKGKRSDKGDESGSDKVLMVT